MTLDEYQKGAEKTAKYPDKGSGLPVYPTLGLTSEAGEVADKVKKAIRDEGGVISDSRRKDLLKELGDVLWYVAQCATELGLSLEDVARQNLEKLASRKERGKIGGSGDDR